jgi:hypothetical protein
LAFKSLPDYLNVVVGQQLESVKELGGRPVRGRGTLTEKDTWLKYWFAKTPGELDTTLKFPDAKQLSSSLRDNHKPEELEHLELLKFPGAQQLPSFLRDNHTPEELEHLELQVARMILNSKIRVFQLSKELTRDDFDKMVKNSQEIPVKVNGDLSELFHKSELDADTFDIQDAFFSPCMNPSPPFIIIIAFTWYRLRRPVFQGAQLFARQRGRIQERSHGASPTKIEWKMGWSYKSNALVFR